LTGNREEGKKCRGSEGEFKSSKKNVFRDSAKISFVTKKGMKKTMGGQAIGSARLKGTTISRKKTATERRVTQNFCSECAKKRKQAEAAVKAVADTN